MKINDVEVMILKVSEPKTNKNNEIYYMVDFAIIEDGSSFSLMVKDTNLIKTFDPFQKTVVNLELTNSKYGLVLKIV